MKKFFAAVTLSLAFLTQGYADTQGIQGLSDQKVNIDFTAPDSSQWRLGDDQSDQ